MKRVSNISDAEFEVIRAIWENGNEMNTSQLRKELQIRLDWNASTTKTLVRRLCQKGVLKAQKREVLYYTPLITQQEYNLYEVTKLINKLYDGDTTKLLDTLIDNKLISKQDVNSLI